MESVTNRKWNVPTCTSTCSLSLGVWWKTCSALAWLYPKAYPKAKCQGITHTSKIEDIIWFLQIEAAKSGVQNLHRRRKKIPSAKGPLDWPFYINLISSSRFEPVPPLIPQGTGMLVFCSVLHFPGQIEDTRIIQIRSQVLFWRRTTCDGPLLGLLLEKSEKTHGFFAIFGPGLNHNPSRKKTDQIEDMGAHADQLNRRYSIINWIGYQPWKLIQSNIFYLACFEILVFDQHHFPKRQKNSSVCLWFGDTVGKNTISVAFSFYATQNYLLSAIYCHSQTFSYRFPAAT